MTLAPNKENQCHGTIPKSVVLRCIANYLETSEFYAGKGNRALADWWHDRAEIYAERIATYRELSQLTTQRHTTSS
jgi:hypothetical protein